MPILAKLFNAKSIKSFVDSLIFRRFKSSARSFHFILFYSILSWEKSSSCFLLWKKGCFFILHWRNSYTLA